MKTSTLTWFGIGAFAVAATMAAGASAVQTRTFTRMVAPFAVADEAGRPFDLPFLGGLDVPRPQFADIDGDGDHDLFLQEYRNDIRFFQNTGTAKAPRYEWRTDRYQDLEVGEWYRFVDLDADGDVDLLAEQPFSNIRFYRNTGTKQAATFEPGGILNDTDGQPLFLDRQNIPAIVDLDCDGRLDLFIGRVEGLVTRYEADAPGSPEVRVSHRSLRGHRDHRPQPAEEARAVRCAMAPTRWRLPTSTTTRIWTCSGATSSSRGCC